MKTPPPPPPIITVDGPSGVGKGMVTRWLAAQTHFHRLDSGALYRILALAAHDADIPLTDSAQVAALASELDIAFVGTSEDDEAIMVNGQNLTQRVRAETTGELASQIATAPVVREALLQRQRAFLCAPGLIADGRDMGTVVFPQATLKLFLDADPMERAQRRLKQLSQNGIQAKLEILCEEIRARDHRDRSRAIAPLKAAGSAYVIDTTGLSAKAVIAKVAVLMQQTQF